MLRHVGDMAYVSPAPNPVSNPNPRSNRRSTLMAAVMPVPQAMPTPGQRVTQIARLMGQHLRKVGPTRILRRIVVVGFVALVVSGIGHAFLHPARNEPSDAAMLVSSLTEERATLASVPTSFDSNLGYRPVAVAGTLVDPNGGCSTPGRIGPASFDTACRTHDLGYDVLRFAEADGDRLGAWARFDLDLLLYANMLEPCETARCQATATAYYTAVTANSIRQGYKAPTEEPTGPWLGVGLIVLGLALIPPVGSLWRVATKRWPEIQFFQTKVRELFKGSGKGSRRQSPPALAIGSGSCIPLGGVQAALMRLVVPPGLRLRRVHHLSYRDIATVIGLSHRRVGQLAIEVGVDITPFDTGKPD